MHRAMRLTSPCTSLAPPGYCLQIAWTRRLKVATESSCFSVLRRRSSAHPQTFSWGLRSGECAGQERRRRMRLAFKADLLQKTTMKVPDLGQLRISRQRRHAILATEREHSSSIRAERDLPWTSRHGSISLTATLKQKPTRCRICNMNLQNVP